MFYSLFIYIKKGHLFQNISKGGYFKNETLVYLYLWEIDFRIAEANALLTCFQKENYCSIIKKVVICSITKLG